MTARIFSPPKNPMQSGRGKLGVWQLEFDSAQTKSIDPLMGWASQNNTIGQIKLSFVSKEEAIEYAKSNGIEYSVVEPKPVKRIIRSYSENFAFSKKEPWSH